MFLTNCLHKKRVYSYYYVHQYDSGVVSVNVNVVGRIAFVKYDSKVISAADILRLLNEAHLGVFLHEEMVSKI